MSTSGIFHSIVDTGEALYDLARGLSEWSQATFGTDKERGPIGPLKHLAKEAEEARKEWSPAFAPTIKFREEMADCLILVLDASRRAGVKPLELIRDALKKMEVNKKRQWPAPDGRDEPMEHIKG